MKNVQFLLIDPQVDFCDPSGALCVPGAWEDMERVMAMFGRIGDRFTDVHVTLDQHHAIDVAHPTMWRGTDGKQPAPFTIIQSSDIESGKWTPFLPSVTLAMIEYTKKLEAGGRYPLCIWPPHCLIGYPGSSIVGPVRTALSYWVEKTNGVVDFVSKGSNIWTEHYSAYKAEVVDPSDITTQPNNRLLEVLEEADEIVVAGEAGSHCLASTLRDIASDFTDQSYISKFTLLTDATSPVTGFENLQDDFINEMTAKGMKLSTTEDILK